MDRVLVAENRAQDREDAFERLFRDHHAEVYVYLCRLVGDRHQAEDLAQDAFVKAYRALPRLPKDANGRA